MQIIGSIVQEQGVTFAIVLVKKNVVDNPLERDKATESFTSLFPGMPLVLAAQDSAGAFTFYGRKDISAFLASTDPTAIPWKEYTVS